MLNVLKPTQAAKVFFAAITLGVTSGAAAENLVIQAGSTSGSWYPAAVAISELLQDTYDDLSVTVGPGGAVSNARGVHSGADVDMAMIYASTWQAALKGAHPFQQELPDSRFVMAMFEVVYHGGVAVDSGISDYSDLAGKRLMPGKRGWSTNTLTQAILEANGVSYEQIRSEGGQISYVGYDDMTRAMADRQVDFVAGFQAYPTAFWMNVEARRDVKFLPVDQKTADKVRDKIPGLTYTKIPAGAYEQVNPDTAIPTLGDVTIMIANKDVDPDLVYRVVKTAYENRKRLGEASSYLTYISRETVTSGADENNVHPGAGRYYKEQQIGF